MSDDLQRFVAGPGQLSTSDLLPLESYAGIRDQLRQRVVEHKKARRLPVGDHVTLLFEDRLTMQYQVQEMLRIERIFEPDGIAEELGAYNPLIPDGSNWKATMLIEYPDVAERRGALEKLVGIENRVWVKIGDQERVMAVADEDLDRSTGSKTSAVHFLRFELSPAMITSLNEGDRLAMGIEHDEYNEVVDPVSDDLRGSLQNDLVG